MELQRYEMGDYCSGYVPNDDGEVCMSYDVQRLEESHAELLGALKAVEIAVTMGFPSAEILHDDSAIRKGIRAAIAKAEGHKEEKITDNHVHLEDDETVCDHCFRKESNCMCSDYDIDADFGDK